MHSRAPALNSRLILWAITSALAGFLYGFDTVVISGAEQQIQKLWGLSPQLHGLAIASALYGTVLGTLCGGWCADQWGRKKTLLAVGALYVASAVGSALAPDVCLFTFARALGGLGIGISTVAAPLYISEISPAYYRGRLTGLFQANIVLGLVVAYTSNAWLAGSSENDWRWMLGVAAFPSLLYALLSFGLPESPRWLLGSKNDQERGRAVLRLIEPQASKQDLEVKVQEILDAAAERASAGPFWTRELRKPIALALFIGFFNQFSGINAILYFAPRILEMSGLAARAAMLQTIGVGLTLLVFTGVGVWLIDRVGRRTLLYIGSYGYILSLGLLSWAFYFNHVEIVPLCLFAFMAAHAVGQGTVIWVYLSEIFPNRHRAQGQTLGGATHWICSALLTSVFPWTASYFPLGDVFLFFCVMMIGQLLWVRLSVIETKGLSLEEVQKKLRLVPVDQNAQAGQHSPAEAAHAKQAGNASPSRTAPDYE